ncbi:MAG: hypothetical protein WB586_18055 [Chthoniobacterales bacterium]
MAETSCATSEENATPAQHKCTERTRRFAGYYGPAGFHFADRVGTGFSERGLGGSGRCYAKDQTRNVSFVNLPEKRPGRWGQGITPAVMKRCVWVEPVLVAQVRFTEWTSVFRLFVSAQSEENRLA